MSGAVFGVVGGIAGGVAALIVNDVGEVAAGTLAVDLMLPVRAVLAGIIFGLGIGLVSGLGAGLLGQFGLLRLGQPAQLALTLDRLLVGRLARGVGMSAAPGLALGLAVGPAGGLVLGLIGTALYGGTFGLFVGFWFAVVAAGLVGGATIIANGIVFGLLRESTQPPSPLANLRGDRTAVALTIGVFVLVGGLGGVLLGAMAKDVGGWLAFGLITGLILGIVAAARYPWARYQVARAWFAARGQLPWRLLAFMEEAHRLGILRQVGAVYQFRHARLQDRLAGPTAPASTAGGAGGGPAPAGSGHLTA